MKLYYAPGTCALAVHIALELTGQPYDLEKVQVGSDEFKKINPIGAVPAAIDSDGSNQVMTQAGAILKYVANKYPEANLGSNDDIVDEFVLDQWLDFLTGDLHPSFWPVFMSKNFTDDHSKEGINKVKERARGNLHRFYKRLEDHLINQDFLVNDRLTVADPYAYAILRWTGYSVLELEDYPSLHQYFLRIGELDATKRALEQQGLV